MPSSGDQTAAGLRSYTASSPVHRSNTTTRRATCQARCADLVPCLPTPSRLAQPHPPLRIAAGEGTCPSLRLLAVQLNGAMAATFMAPILTGGLVVMSFFLLVRQRHSLLLEWSPAAGCRILPGCRMLPAWSSSTACHACRLLRRSRRAGAAVAPDSATAGSRAGT